MCMITYNINYVYILYLTIVRYCIDFTLSQRRVRRSLGAGGKRGEGKGEGLMLFLLGLQEAGDTFGVEVEAFEVVLEVGIYFIIIYRQIFVY